MKIVYIVCTCIKKFKKIEKWVDHKTLLININTFSVLYVYQLEICKLMELQSLTCEITVTYAVK